MLRTQHKRNFSSSSSPSSSPKAVDKKNLKSSYLQIDMPHSQRIQFQPLKSSALHQSQIKLLSKVKSRSIIYHPSGPPS